MSNSERIVLVLFIFCIWIVFGIAYIKHKELDKDIEYVTRHQVHIQQQIDDMELRLIETDKSIVKHWRYVSKVKEAPTKSENDKE